MVGTLHALMQLLRCNANYSLVVGGQLGKHAIRVSPAEVIVFLKVT